MHEHLVVTIQKADDNPALCIANPFRARPGSIVRFIMVGEDSAEIEFMGDGTNPTLFDTPFDSRTFKLNKAGPGHAQIDKKVRDDAPVRGFGFHITWPTGEGNGSGEVIGR